MKRLVIIFLLAIFFLGCKEIKIQVPEDKPKEVSGEVKNISSSEGAVFPSKTDRQQMKIELKPQTEERIADINSMFIRRNDRIISEGRWFFAAGNLREGYVDYYDRYANFLGRKIRIKKKIMNNYLRIELL